MENYVKINEKKTNKKLEKLANLLLTWELSELIEYRDLLTEKLIEDQIKFIELLKWPLIDYTFMSRLMLNVVIDEIGKRGFRSITEPFPINKLKIK
jgi:hypothetical protein